LNTYTVAKCRRYVKSRSAPQLVGDSLLPDTNCDPLRTTPNGTALNPCGLVANSFFTDSFRLSSSTGTTPPVMSETGIAWAVDRSVQVLAVSAVQCVEVCYYARLQC
jgi:LEM3 (ligand-effect modulator 3) family / CDC50 family